MLSQSLRLSAHDFILRYRRYVLLLICTMTNVVITRVRDNDIQLGDITVRHELSGGQSLVA